MFQFIDLAAAMQLIYSTGIEFKHESFVALSGKKLQTYQTKIGVPKERMYEVVAIEPTVIERIPNEKITLELAIVSERDRMNLLKAVKMVYQMSEELKGDNVTFQDRLELIRPRLPDVITKS